MIISNRYGGVKCTVIAQKKYWKCINPNMVIPKYIFLKVLYMSESTFPPCVILSLIHLAHVVTPEHSK